MSVKNVKLFNDSVASFAQSTEQMTKAIKSNTREIQKVAQALKEDRQKDIKDWRKLDPLNESTRYPLAQNDGCVKEGDNAQTNMKKLNVI